jgi:hypothetical protein
MATYEGEFIELEDGTHTGVVPKDHPDYRTWVYNRIDGKMEAKVVTAPEAEKLYDEGWRMTPAAFTEDEDLKGRPEFEAVADDMAQVMNTLLNIDASKDKEALTEFAEGFLQMKVDKRWGLAKLKENIKTTAKELGLFEEE